MRWTVSTLCKLVHQFHHCSSNVNMQKFSFFIRSVPIWNALSPTSVCADSVAVFAVFHLRICNNIVKC